MSRIMLCHQVSLSIWSKTSRRTLGFAPVLKQASYIQDNNEGTSLDMQGRLQEAVTMFKKALEAKPDYAEAWFNLGNTYGKLGKFQDAISCFDNAMKYKQGYYEALSNRGVAKASMGHIPEALKDLSAAISGKPDLGSAYFNRAIVYLNAGKKDLACPDLVKANQLGFSAAYAIYQKECNKK